MPIPGTGAVPTAGGLYNELTAVVRRAFVPKLFVQIYFASPTLFYLMGNSQRSAGGLSQITIPMQGQSMVQGQFTNYGGGFNSPQVTPGIQNGQWNTAYWVVPIPLPFGETVIQATEREISLLKARMNDAYAVTWQNMARLTFTNNSAYPQYPNSFYDAFDDGTNVATYGGISRSTPANAAFKGQYINVGIGTTWNTTYLTGSTGFTRASMASLINYVTDKAGGEKPTCVIMSPPDFAKLNGDFIGAEQVFIRPGQGFNAATINSSSFPNLNVSDVPIFQDHFCPVGEAYMPNMKYTNMFVSEDANLDFSGFYSLVPLGQIGQQGIVVLGYNTVSAKSSSGAHIYGIGGAPWT